MAHRTTSTNHPSRRNGHRPLAKTMLEISLRIALYARVSTDEQAEKNTIQAQLDFLRDWARLYDLPIVGEYTDEGISGTVPLSDRPGSSQLLADAQAGIFGAVVVYRVDRFARSLRVLLDGYNELEAASVAFKSITEPFDTSIPMGKFVFQMLGSMAELERSTILERMTNGRDRVVKGGRWTDGPIPFGYTVDSDCYLIPSPRMVEVLGMTEADLVRDLFQRIADGSSSIAETRRLNAVGIPTTCHYTNGTQVTTAVRWRLSRVLQMLRNPLYKGEHTFQSANGAITRTVPALVDQITWERAQVQLLRNRHQVGPKVGRLYLLRGLIRCQCGYYYSGQSLTKGRKMPYYSYRCGSSRSGSLHASGTSPCGARVLHAPWLEEAVWEDIRGFIRNPGTVITQLEAQLAVRRTAADAHEAARAKIRAALAAKAKERDPILLLFRRGTTTLEDTETQLQQIAQEEGALRQQLATLDADQQLTDAFEDRLTGVVSLLNTLRTRLEDIEQHHDEQTKRRVIEQLVDRIDVKTFRSKKTQKKEATIRIYYAFTPGDVTQYSTERSAGTKAILCHNIVRVLRTNAKAA